MTSLAKWKIVKLSRMCSLIHQKHFDGLFNLLIIVLTKFNKSEEIPVRARCKNAGTDTSVTVTARVIKNITDVYWLSVNPRAKFQGNGKHEGVRRMRKCRGMPISFKIFERSDCFQYCYNRFYYYTVLYRIMHGKQTGSHWKANRSISWEVKTEMIIVERGNKIFVTNSNCSHFRIFELRPSLDLIFALCKCSRRRLCLRNYQARNIACIYR